MTKNSGFFDRFLLDNKFWLVRHFLFWAFMYLDEFLSFLGLTPPLELPKLVIAEIAADMALVYINIYYLLPRFLLKRKFVLYSLYTAISIILVIIFDEWIYPEDTDDAGFYYSIIINTTVSTIGILGVAVALKIFKQNYLNRRKIDELQQLNLKTELAYLKNQMNPHFLFNALNTIYVQSKKTPEQVPEAILNLSDLLRYQIYDSQKEEIGLKKEVEYLKNYMRIARERQDHLKVTFEEEGQLNGITIAPLIFLPLVENAFKHSQRLDNDTTWLTVLLKVENHTISFVVKNSIPSKPNQNGGHGIGLSNLKRRLNLLYPDTHTLHTTKRDDSFEATLILKTQR